ncbi:unnamed protein product [Didymodactylos carnosus]|nr:unnamed protein product [Didymodactylos carnosus]CAF3939401.1 unnamed protein product [Didymodactylos carnosus]
MGKPETFDPYYGVKDISDDGDITKPENIDALQAYVLKCTMKLGVHVATADGGFSVEGQENIQEILSKQLYLCQFLGALSVLRPGGNFVCKLFDLFTPFSVGLVYLMYRTFNQISIHKPVSSRPANSERYIICKGLRESVRDIVRVYMYEINSKQCKHRNDTEPNDIQSIVPLDIIKSNHEFCNYIIASNNTKLIDTRQSNIRQQCLTLWNIPDEQRPKRRRLLYNDIYNELFGRLDQGIENYILNTPNLLKKCVLNQNQMASLFDYRCVLSLGDPVLLLSCGRSQVYSIDLRHKNKCWTLLEKTPFKIELPPYTLLLGEKVLEDFREGRTLRQKPAIYIIDAYFIGNENILMNNKGPVVFIDRFRSMKLFEKTINKPSRYDLAPIRVSEQLRCEHLDANITKLCESGHYDQIDSEKLWYVNESVVENKPRVQVHGIWFFKFVQCPWTILWGRSKQQKYFHNQNTRVSESVAPSDYSHVASLRSMLENSFYWDFNTNFRDDTVSKSNMISFIRGKTDQQQRPSQQQQHNHT